MQVCLTQHDRDVAKAVKGGHDATMMGRESRSPAKSTFQVVAAYPDGKCCLCDHLQLQGHWLDDEVYEEGIRGEKRRQLLRLKKRFRARCP